MHCHMRASGMNSHIMVLDKIGNDPDVTAVSNRLSPPARLRLFAAALRKRLLRRLSRISLYFNVEGAAVIKARQLMDFFPFRPDVILVHWVAGFVDPAVLRDLNRLSGAPIIWYLMDMAAFTGGCHYAFGCSAYTASCGNCPQLGLSRSSHDLSYRQLKTKTVDFQQTDITAVAASSWLKNQVSTASAFKDKRIETILLGVDADLFCPLEQAHARKKLGLPSEGKIIFFAASNLQEERKGIKHLLRALSHLYAMLETNVALRERIIVVTAGHAQHAENLGIEFEHRHLGYLDGDQNLAAGYQSADIFVNASVEDSGPMMINESLLCGTPVVSFEMGVAIDLVLDEVTGYRARLGDETDLANGLCKILELSPMEASKMRQSCRDHGIKLCHPDRQVAAFEQLFRSLVSNREIPSEADC